MAEKSEQAKQRFVKAIEIGYDDYQHADVGRKALEEAGQYPKVRVRKRHNGYAVVGWRRIDGEKEHEPPSGTNK